MSAAAAAAAPSPPGGQRPQLAVGHQDQGLAPVSATRQERLGAFRQQRAMQRDAELTAAGGGMAWEGGLRGGVGSGGGVRAVRPFHQRSARHSAPAIALGGAGAGVIPAALATDAAGCRLDAAMDAARVRRKSEVAEALQRRGGAPLVGLPRTLPTTARYVGGANGFVFSVAAVGALPVRVEALWVGAGPELRLPVDLHVYSCDGAWDAGGGGGGAAFTPAQWPVVGIARLLRGGLTVRVKLRHAGGRGAVHAAAGGSGGGGGGGGDGGGSTIIAPGGLRSFFVHSPGCPVSVGFGVDGAGLVEPTVDECIAILPGCAATSTTALQGVQRGARHTLWGSVEYTAAAELLRESARVGVAGVGGGGGVGCVGGGGGVVGGSGGSGFAGVGAAGEWGGAVETFSPATAQRVVRRVVAAEPPAPSERLAMLALSPTAMLAAATSPVGMPPSPLSGGLGGVGGSGGRAQQRGSPSPLPSNVVAGKYYGAAAPQLAGGTAAAAHTTVAAARRASLNAAHAARVRRRSDVAGARSAADVASAQKERGWQQ